MAQPLLAPLAALDHATDEPERTGDVSARRAATKFREFMEALGLDMKDPNLSETEWRVARAFRELFAGCYAGTEPTLQTFPSAEGYAETVAVTDIPFHSVCAHHFLPFYGTAHLAYVPKERLVGLSKLARVVDFYARRPQLQERMAEQIAELAASLTQAGVHVAVVEAAPHVWARFADPTLAGFFQDYCARKGVTFYTNERVSEIRENGRSSAVMTRAGRELSCDFVCIGVGIVPNVELARQAGLAVDDGVVVNEFLQSSHPDIYAAGDLASYLDPVFGKRRRMEHWGHAEYSGQLAGRNMTGAREPYDLLTYVWSDVFDLHLEFAGDESEHDQILVRGCREDGAFTVLYLRDGALRAYFAVNSDSRELPIRQRLIRTGMILVGRDAQLQDPGFAIQGVL